MVPLQQLEVDAANCIHDLMEAWRNDSEVMQKLRDELRDQWDVPASLLRCIAINGLYSTNVFAIRRMANHVSRVMTSVTIDCPPADLVERIATLSWDEGKSRKFTSFASKLCNLFVDSEAYPIFDNLAQETLKHHLCDDYKVDPSRPYGIFRENLSRLRAVSGVSASNTQLDHYLWIKGLCLRRASRKMFNSDFRDMLRQPVPGAITYLKILLPDMKWKS